MSLAEIAKLQAIFDGMNEVGKKASGSIAQIKVEFGWHRYISKELGFWFAFVPVPSKDESDAAQEACYTILKKNGSTESPSFGLRTYIFGETALPTPWKSDSGEFIAIWQSDAYDMLQKKLVLVAGFAFNKTLWARFKNVPDPFFVAQGESGKQVLRIDKDDKAIKDSEGKNIYDYKTIRVVTEVFPNEIAARKAADEGSASSNGPLELSTTAKKNNMTIELLEKHAEEINGKLQSGMDNKIVAGQYGVEPQDLQFAVDRVKEGEILF